MNNYSWIDQKLHQIALKKKFIREATFDIESSIFSPKENSDKHIFIAGLARAGTTVLLNAIHKSEEFASLSYEDMPFILAPNIWSMTKLKNQSEKYIERAHGDRLTISNKSPEAFEEIFWMTFNENNNRTAQKFSAFVNLINHKYKKERYLSKNNQNIKRIELINKIYPNSKIIIPFRDPIRHAYSLLEQHKRFINICKKDKFINNYIKWIGHKEFGPHYVPIFSKGVAYKKYLNHNHWLEQWYLTYKKQYSISKKNKNIYFISYEDLCQSKEYWIDLSNKLCLKKKYPFDFCESKNDPTVTYDNNLSQKAYKIYQELKNTSY